MEIIYDSNFSFELEASCPVDCCVIDCDFCGIDGVCGIDI